MHARHRSPGNGYRSSPAGLGGVGAASRISPDSSIRGHGLYQSYYRGYNRGFGRGHPKSYQPPQPPLPPPPRRGDVFMEAGRLAAEYLVSKGLLPPSALSGKWQNGGLKNQVGDFQGFRPQGENLQFPPESRTPALSRLANATADTGSGRRRFPDEYDAAGTRNNIAGRRRAGSLKNDGAELNQELGRSGSWSDRASDSSDLDGQNSAFSGYPEEQQVAKEDSNELQKSRVQMAPKSESAYDLEADLEKYALTNYARLKASSSIDQDLTVDAEVEPTYKSTDKNVSHVETGEMKDGSSDELEKQSATEDMGTEHSSEDDLASKSDNDLLKHCKFAKVPTKTRSSLTHRNMKNDPVRNAADRNCHENGLHRGSGAVFEDVAVGDSKTDSPSNQNQSLQFVDSEISEAPTGKDAGEVGPGNPVGHELHMESGSFPERSLMIEQESTISVVMGRGEKRALEYDNGEEVSKRAKEWVSSLDSPDDDHLPISKLKEKFQISQEERTPPNEQKNLGADQKRSMDVAMSSKCAVEPSSECAEEKQLFLGSFKICDLNLMEGSDVNETHDADPIIFPSITECKKASAKFDIDLSMNNCNMSNSYARLGVDGKEVEVIYLENDSTPEHRSFSCPDKKEETGLTDLESFDNHAHNANDMPDGQNGYGLMISELLGTDIPNCSSVPSDINPLHNDMGLHNGEEILGDDDSIYMSLGEIPISFLEVWEQPTQEFEKRF